MSKDKIDKKVNRKVKRFNKILREDVYKDRFYIKQWEKRKINDMHYYIYCLYDKKYPNRIHITDWVSELEILKFNELEIRMNDFIITSDF